MFILISHRLCRCCSCQESFVLLLQLVTCKAFPAGCLKTQCWNEGTLLGQVA